MSDLYTRREWALLPEGFPAQLIEGLLVKEAAPDFGHQRVTAEILARCRACVGPGRAVPAPADVPIDEFNVFQPDVVVLAGQPPDDALDVGIPLIAFEVVSPATGRRDRTVKRIRLLDAGTAEVWIVDRHGGVIEVYDRGRYRDVPRRVTGSNAIESQVLPGLSLRPDELFQV